MALRQQHEGNAPPLSMFRSQVGSGGGHLAIAHFPTLCFATWTGTPYDAFGVSRIMYIRPTLLQWGGAGRGWEPVKPPSWLSPPFRTSLENRIAFDGKRLLDMS